MVHELNKKEFYNVFIDENENKKQCSNGGFYMNILFFLTPKSDVVHVYEDETLRQVIEKVEYHKYTAVPMLSKDGKYMGTVTEGDLLRIIKNKYRLNLEEAEDIPICRVPLRWTYKTVCIDCDIEDLVDVAVGQNFVPVVDDGGYFIGIIRRSDILRYFYQKSRDHMDDNQIRRQLIQENKKLYVVG